MTHGRLTRLAPSPTGALHLGNARTFLVNWLIARQQGMRIVLRIDDLDSPRTKRGADLQAIDDLRWLGIDWDEGPVYQTQRLPRYAELIDQLARTHHVYPCVCTRREIERAASAPHAEDGATVYPGTCRGRFLDGLDAQSQSGRAPALRFRLDQSRFAFDDGFAGRVEFAPATELGDFIIAKPDGTPAYQLAVVIDDHDAGVTDVVRGNDLLDSVPRQVALYHALGWADAIPRYTHLPLIVGEDGRRLAKRHGDTRVATYRAAGVPAPRLLALLARWLGIGSVEAISADDLLARFDLSRVPAGPIVFTGDDDRWLRTA